MTRQRLNFLAAAVLGPALLLAWPAPAQLPNSFDLYVPAPPRPAHVAGGTELVYELHLSNFALQALDPLRLEVTDGRDVLAVFDGDALVRRTDRSGQQLPSADYDAIPPGRRGIVFLEFDPGASPPRALGHRLHFRATDADGTTHTHVVEGGHVIVETADHSPLGPPLSGGPWVAIGDAAWERGHRRVAYTLAGKVRTPGRFAFDWVKVDPEGGLSRDGGDRPDSAHSYGEAVLAVADATVVDVRNDVGERRSLSETLTPAQRREDGSGNAIVLDLGDGRFAHYAHLRPDSILVTPGQRVRRGETIAQVGFSGSASAPQLHFSVTDGAVENASEGLPYRLDAFEFIGIYADAARMGSGPWDPAGTAAGPRTAEMPARGAVLGFREAP